MGDNESKSEGRIQKHVGWKFWTTVIGTVAMAVVAIVAVLNYFSNKSTPFTTSTITANAIYRHIALPSSYEDALSSISAPYKISADKEIKALLQKLPEKSRKDAIEAISNYINLNMPFYLGARRQNLGNDIKGWWYIDIENISDVTFYDVVLEIPGFIVATEVYRKSSGLIEIEENSSYVKLGDIRPHENVSISAWTNRFSNITNEKFKLTHKDGVGKVHIKEAL